MSQSPSDSRRPGSTPSRAAPGNDDWASGLPGGISTPCSVLVVEADALARGATRLALEQAGGRVYEATSGEEGLALSDRHRPQVALLGFGPALDGVELCRLLRQRWADLAILILTEQDDGRAKVTGLNFGADDYLVKPLAQGELVARINAVLRRCFREKVRPGTLVLDDLCLDLHALKVFKAGQEVDLTRREFALLATFLKHPGRVLTREELRVEVWGQNHHGSPKALDVFVCKLREKLDDDPAHPHYIRTQWGVGFVCGEAGTLPLPGPSLAEILIPATRGSPRKP